MLLWWIAIGGVMLMALSRSWVMEARREREAELVFRAEQIRSAIEAYARVPVAQEATRLPLTLEDLLADRRGGRMARHLRKAWPDPITGEPWGFIRDEKNGIQGLYSRSQAAPLRGPAGVLHYSEWRFEADPAREPPTAPSEPDASRPGVPLR